MKKQKPKTRDNTKSKVFSYFPLVFTAFNAVNFSPSILFAIFHFSVVTEGTLCQHHGVFPRAYSDLSETLCHVEKAKSRWYAGE